jgi:hypothetical protein
VKPPLPERYFGNALVRAVATATVQDITSEALASIAGRIGGAISRVDDELVRSAIDYCDGLFGKWRNQVDGRGLKGILRNFDL